MLHVVIAVIAVVALGFGIGRIKNYMNFKAKVKAAAEKAVLEAKYIKSKL